MKSNTKKEFTPDAFVIRTSKKDGTAYGGFPYPKEIGAIVEAPDWEPTAKCGHGLHGLLDGQGAWSLLSSEHDALWWIIGVIREECISIDADKVKFPRGKVVYFGGINGAMQAITKEWRHIALEAAKEVATEAISTAGNYAHASTAGYRAHASTAGKKSVSSALGDQSKARAGEGGAIVLVNRDEEDNIVAIRASKVGENGIKPGVFYSLSAEGEFIEEGAENV